MKAFVAYMRGQEICKTDSKKGECAFPYVGVVEFRPLNDGKGGAARRMVFLEPKFFKDDKTSAGTEGEFSKGQEIVLKAILKYCKKQRASLFSSGQLTGAAGDTTQLSRYLALVLDVMENGIYQVPRSEFRVNGPGNISWEATFARMEPTFLPEGPAYVDFITRETDYDDDCYISRLQSFLAATCLRRLNDMGLAGPFGLHLEDPFVNCSLDEFGPEDYIIARIRAELNVQFIDVKRNSLKLMLSVLEESESLMADRLEFQSFGMSGFHSLWEVAIKEVLRDDLDKTPRALGLDHVEKEKADVPLWQFVDPPVWVKSDSTEEALPVEDEGDRLEPDFVAARVGLEDGETFVILDAKYYVPEFVDNQILRQPGVGDVDKQLLYQLAYTPLAKKMRNAFIFPEHMEPAMGQEGTLRSRHFATIKVPVFGLGGLPMEFDSYMVDGLALLEKYVYSVCDDDERSLLKGILGPKTETVPATA